LESRRRAVADGLGRGEVAAALDFLRTHREDEEIRRAFAAALTTRPEVFQLGAYDAFLDLFPRSPEARSVRSARTRRERESREREARERRRAEEARRRSAVNSHRQSRRTDSWTYSQCRPQCAAENAGNRGGLDLGFELCMQRCCGGQPGCPPPLR
jgi:hypothetical protein